jgi:hypothetical protein
MQARNRYAGSCVREIRIHPFKRAIAFLARFLPKSWRFFLFGLPPRASANSCHELEQHSIGILIRNGIVCQLGAHLDASGAYIPHLTPGAGSFMENRFLRKQRCLPKVQHKAGTILSLAVDGDLNYYRWLMETLPRMRLVREKHMSYDWLYCCQQGPFHRRSLQLIGVEADRVIPSDRNKFVQAERLIVPPFVEETETWVVPWLREQFLPLVRDSPSDSTPKRIYISRRKASGRRIGNEPDLLDALAPLGFVSTILEDYEWLEQVTLFQSAEAVVGPHGAGLANLVFCSKSAVVIEFIAPRYPFTFYPEISRQLGLRHHLISCSATAPGAVDSSDLIIDVGNLLRLLKEYSIQT